MRSLLSSFPAYSTPAARVSTEVLNPKP